VSAPAARLRVGTSGYQYRHWKGRFYPEDLPQRRWFAYYAGSFDTVEINNTFYHLPAPEVFVHWREQAPKGFEYTLKFNRYGSHVKRLRDGAQTIERYLANAAGLGRCLGPTLIQLPPRFKADAPRLDAFLAAAPRARRWAVEFRDRDWLRDEVFEVLQRHGAALCIHDLIPDHPRELTADWTYLRFHGDHYGGSYSTQFLSAEARRIAALLRGGHAVYAYFNNDRDACAVRNALDLRRYVDAAGQRLT
jgi:uncharacterized protein YecE (DUF72 family)